MCYGMKCPYEFPSGECSILGNCEIPEEAECMKGEVDEHIREAAEVQSRVTVKRA